MIAIASLTGDPIMEPIYDPEVLDLVARIVSPNELKPVQVVALQVIKDDTEFAFRIRDSISGETETVVMDWALSKDKPSLLYHYDLESETVFTVERCWVPLKQYLERKDRSGLAGQIIWIGDDDADL